MIFDIADTRLVSLCNSRHRGTEFKGAIVFANLLNLYTFSLFFVPLGLCPAVPTCYNLLGGAASSTTITTASQRSQQIIDLRKLASQPRSRPFKTF